MTTAAEIAADTLTANPNATLEDLTVVASGLHAKAEDEFWIWVRKERPTFYAGW